MRLTIEIGEFRIPFSVCAYHYQNNKINVLNLKWTLTLILAIVVTIALI